MVNSAVPPAADAPPPSVQRALDFFRDRGIWHVPSKNPPVRSCAEAAGQRRRQGAIGIPLRDELKSLLYAYSDEEGHRRYALLHVRGHHRVDLPKASAVLQSIVQRVANAELEMHFRMSYGTVTPVLFADRSDVRHVIDTNVLRGSGPPFTMMTNAGHLEYAVEFRPEEVFAALPRTAVNNIGDTGKLHR